MTDLAPHVQLLLGEKRVEDAIRAENFGLASQRLSAILGRGVHRYVSGWHIEHGPLGEPLRMVWTTWQVGG